MNKEKFLVDFKNKNTPVEIIGDIVDWKVDVKCKCLLCNEEFYMRPINLKRGSIHSKCSYKIRGKNKKSSTNEFKDKLYNVNKDIEVIGEYEKAIIPIEVKCKICGHIWKSTPNNLLRNHGCPICYYNKISTKSEEFKDYDLDKIRDEVFERYKTLNILEPISNLNSDINCECQDCGYKWTSTLKKLSLLTSDNCCPVCAGRKFDSNELLAYIKDNHIDIENVPKLKSEIIKSKGMENPEDMKTDRFSDLAPGQIFYNVAANKSEHFTSPPKQYSEDTLLAAMETAGNKEFDEDTEKKGLGTPATRAGIIEKLVHSQYAVRKGKQIIPTEDGKVLIEILPDFLKSASMTAEWENQLLDMEKGKITPDTFMTGIKNMITMMLNGCDTIPEEETRRFQTRESIGTCPVCGSLVYEGKKNFYCSNRECRFALWKETKYLERMLKTIDKRMAAELLKSGKVRVKDLYSAKKNMYFEADLIMDASEDRVNFSLDFPSKKPSGKGKKK